MVFAPLLALAVMPKFGTAQGSSQKIPLSLIPNKFSSIIGGYLPTLLPLSTQRPQGLGPLPAQAVNPQFATINYENKHYTFVLSRNPSGKAQIWFDSNGDGQFGNDPGLVWMPNVYHTVVGNGADAKTIDLTMYTGRAKMMISFKGKREAVSIGFYSFDPKDPQRKSIANDLIIYNDFGFKSKIKFGATAYPVYLGDSSLTAFTDKKKGLAEAMIGIDRRGNGSISGQAEEYFGAKPININGTTLQFAGADVNAGVATFVPSTQKVDEIPLPPDFSVGSKVVPFTEKLLSGKVVHFPQDYAGKIVMLDFWATWCEPCKGEIPYSTAAYEKYHSNGFDILGVSLDQANKADLVKSFTASHKMTWPQIYEGKFWDVSLVKTYGVEGIPFVLLVDGSTGKILATENQLRGTALMPTIKNALTAKHLLSLKK